MKLLSGIIIGFALIMLSAFSPINHSESESVLKPAFEVCAIHEIEVKSEVNLKEFEAFVLKEIAPVYNKMKGQHFALVKGDRGMRTNNYAIILTFDSVEDRDRIYPPSGEYTEDFGGEELWNKFDAMLVSGMGVIHTDYIRVAH
jgi:hypothetical protein